jgi:hypothetical protein
MSTDVFHVRSAAVILKMLQLHVVNFTYLCTCMFTLQCCQYLRISSAEC